MEGLEGVMITGNAVIDTRAPFSSVKEAVMLFGERVLAGELYSAKYKLKQDGPSEDDSDPFNLTDELKETKQSLERAREERLVMVTCLTSLEEELERTRKELENLKVNEQNSKKQVTTLLSDIEDLKYIEKSQDMAHENSVAFQKQRYVTFANPPTLISELVIPQGDGVVLQRHPSLKKKKKKLPLIPFIGGIFSRK